MNNHLIIGNCIAALVASLELAKKGNEVILITNGEKLGGHFSGIEISNLHYDLGMAVVELTSTNAECEPDIKSYNTLVRNDVGRFFNLLEKYINEIQPLININSPKTYFRGKLYEDFLLCNSFDIFKSFTNEERELIQFELKDLDKHDSCHASKKIINQDFHTEVSYEKTSLFNHGKFIHTNIIEPYIKKISGFKSRDISSIFHRRFWAPLYYPETIIKAAKGEIHKFGDTIIHYPHNAQFKSFSESLIKKIKAFKSVEIINKKVSSIHYKEKSLTLESGKVLEFKKIGWASSLKKCHNSLKINPTKDKKIFRSGLTFDFILLDNEYLLKTFSVIFIIDQNIPCYRITNQSLCSQSKNSISKLVVEYNDIYLSKFNILSKEEVHNTSIDSLIEIGIIKEKKAIKRSEVINFPDLLPIPSKTYEENANKNISIIKNSFPGIYLFGESSGIATRSFADNIIQGIQYAEKNTN